jgi:hypothetical protein
MLEFLKIIYAWMLKMMDLTKKIDTELASPWSTF